MNTETQRPTGEYFIVGAWMSLTASVLSGAYGMLQAQISKNRVAEIASMDLYDAEGYLADSLGQAALAGTASWTFFYVFLALICTGYIIRAISFLPGRDVNTD